MATNPIQSSAMQQHMGPSCLSERRCTVVGAPVKLSQANWTPLVIKKHLERKKIRKGGWAAPVCKLLAADVAGD